MPAVWCSQWLKFERLRWEPDPLRHRVRAIGRRVAYWFLRKHPGDQTDQTNVLAGDQYTRVPAEQVLHIRKPIEAGQLRGLPYITPALVRLFQMDQYMDAQVERQKTAALFVGFVVQAEPDAASGRQVGTVPTLSATRSGPAISER